MIQLIVNDTPYSFSEFRSNLPPFCKAWCSNFSATALFLAVPPAIAQDLNETVFPETVEEYNAQIFKLLEQLNSKDQELVSKDEQIEVLNKRIRYCNFRYGLLY